MKIAIANDHAALELKLALKQHMEQRGHEVWDFGTDTSARVEYPAYAEKLARAVANGEADGGVLLCGTGIGMSIAANKVRGVRAALCNRPTMQGMTGPGRGAAAALPAPCFCL